MIIIIAIIIIIIIVISIIIIITIIIIILIKNNNNNNNNNNHNHNHNRNHKHNYAHFPYIYGKNLSFMLAFSTFPPVQFGLLLFNYFFFQNYYRLLATVNWTWRWKNHKSGWINNFETWTIFSLFSWIKHWCPGG